MNWNCKFCAVIWLKRKKSTRNHGNFFHIFQIQKDESERFSCRQRSNEEKFSYREIGIRYEWLKVVNNG